VLGDLERKLAAIVADGVAARTHLEVGIAPVDPPAAGRGTISIGLSDLSPDPGFAPSRVEFGGTSASPTSRRVLPLAFKAGLSFILRPAADTGPARGDARALILEDMAAVAHLLADPVINIGTGFAIAAPDPGFSVQAFALDAGSIQPDLDEGHYAGRLDYFGRAEIWPVGVLAGEGVILAVDPLIVPLPVEMRVADAGVRPGGSTTITVDAPRRQRLAGPGGGTRTAVRLAVRVLADVPPDQRGTIPAGAAGAETGLRILDVAGPQLVVPYQTPAGNPGPAGRIEYVAVHLATSDNTSGVFLGSAAIRLLGS
jgi:hypothetical protein